MFQILPLLEVEVTENILVIITHPIDPTSRGQKAITCRCGYICMVSSALRGP